jgi:hypothetical protein
MPISGSAVERFRCAPILLLKIDVTVRGQELLRDGRMPVIGHGVKRQLIL